MKCNFKNVEEFYPTPKSLTEKIFEGVDWKMIETVLEPSAGKGDIADYIKEVFEKNDRRYYLDIDCIELEDDLKGVLKSKGYRVVGSDFLRFQTFKHYDLIVMNPPFSNGVTHLMKALKMQEYGGNIICILNAETIKNPYSNERKVLVQKLAEYKADITYYQHEFKSAERPTGVEVAVIKIAIPEPKTSSYIYEELRIKRFMEDAEKEVTAVAPSDFIEAFVANYNLEVEAGIRLIREYKALSPYIMNSLKESKYNQPLLTLKIGDSSTLNVNKFVKLVREKYWEALFKDSRFTGNMTNNQYEEYSRRVKELSNYDFSYYNIKTLQEEMSRNLVRGIEECIINLFEELSHKYSWEPGTSNNIHYYDGWCTNKSWIINKKVILPCMNAWTWRGYRPTDYDLIRKLSDIEKALNYLDGGLTTARSLAGWLQEAEKTGQTKKIRLKYFYITFYKKGTCHIEFTNEELLKKLNIFGSQQKKWLPPAYGKKAYKDMDESERAVVDAFEGGEAEYNKTLLNADYYIYDPKTSLPALEAAV